MDTTRSRPLLVFSLEPGTGGRLTPVLTDGRRCVPLQPLPGRFASLSEALDHVGDRFPRSPVVLGTVDSPSATTDPKETSR